MIFYNQIMSNSRWQETNLALSGWNGVGTSTTALLLAVACSRRYLYLGGLFRYLSQQLGYQDEGEERVTADEYIESQMGKLLDQLFVDLLAREDNLVAESDIGGFLINKWWPVQQRRRVYSIFLHAPAEIRSQRVLDDGRADAVETLRQRDQFHAQKYRDLWQIEAFDLELIGQSYDLVLDTSQLSVAQQCRVIGKRLDQQFADFPEEFDAQLEQALVLHQQAGKAGLRDWLGERQLIITPQVMLQHLRDDFADQVSRLPDDLRRIVTG